MGKILQEFYCGNCQGYFCVSLNTALNYEVEVRCPNCGHEHRRCIVDGVIFENGRFQTNVKEKILVSKATYSKTPLTDTMKNSRKRDGVVIERDPLSQSEFDERWASVAAREKGEI